jgi:hypothetical protein
MSMHPVLLGHLAGARQADILRDASRCPSPGAKQIDRDARPGRPKRTRAGPPFRARLWQWCRGARRGDRT